jgi:hypothetical protein
MGRRWFYSRWAALVIGLVAGAIVGLAVYWGSRLHDVGLFTLCGTVAGGIAALVFWGFARRARLTELKVSIPYLTDVTFAVTPTNEAVAWQLFVQSATRISAQPLTDGTGILHESLDSLYDLFRSVREILLEARPTARGGSGLQTVEDLAIGMLSVQMRPFMAKWHALLSEWEKANPGVPESKWPQNQECREELEEMRLGMLEYIRGLGQLAGAHNIEALIGGEPTR